MGLRTIIISTRVFRTCLRLRYRKWSYIVNFLVRDETRGSVKDGAVQGREELVAINNLGFSGTYRMPTITL